MNDHISRQTIMNAFAEYVKRSNNSDFVPTPTWNDAVEIIENLPSAEEESFEWCDGCKEYDSKEHCCHRFTKVIRNTVEEIRNEQRWIPCKERLPDDGVNVLVQFIDGYTEICRLLGGCWEVLYGEYTGIHTAVAWMPLPEPYKGGEQHE